MKKVFVWAGWGRNFGDLLLLDQQVKLLKQQCPEELLVIPLSSHSINGKAPVLTSEIVDYINSGDMLIIGSGGQLLPDKSRFGFWQFNIPIQMIDDIKVPIVVYGIGSNTFAYPGDGGGLDRNETDVFETHLARVCNRSELCSVRDSIALDLIKTKLGVSKTTLIGDPALLLQPSSLTKPVGIVGLVLGGDRIVERYRSKSDYLNLLVDFAKQIKSFVDESGFISQIKLIPHSSLYDVEYSYIIEQLLQSNDFSFVFEHGLLPESENKLLHLRRSYSECDYIISSRWHGNIIASALGIPNITIGSMLKQQALFQDLGILNWNKGEDLNKILKQSDVNLCDVTKRVRQLQTRTREFSQAVVDLLCH